MPRFNVTVAFDTTQADKDRAAFFGRLKADMKDMGSSNAPNPLRETIKQASKELDDYRSRLASVRGDLANMRRNAAPPINFQGSHRELSELLSDLNRARAAAERVGDLRGVAQYSRLIVQTTRELDKLEAAQKKALGNVAGDNPLIGGRGTRQTQDFLNVIKQLDAQMTQMEAHRAAGRGTLAAYRAELLQIQQAALSRANDTSLSDAERGLYLKRAKRAGSMIDAADTAEAQKLTLAIARLKAGLADQSITADRAGLAFEELAERARTLATTQGVGEAAARRYFTILRQAQQAQGGLATPDPALAAARAQSAAVADLTQKWRANLIVNAQGKRDFGEMRRQLEAVAVAAKEEARNTRLSTEARQANTRAAGEAVAALKRLRGEQMNAATGGNLPFILGNIGFGAGAIGAGTTSFLNDALELNERFRMSAINLEANVKFYKFNADEVNKIVQETAKEIRVGTADVEEAMSFLFKAGFDPQMAKKAIVNAADSAVSNRIDTIRGIKNVAQGAQQGLSMPLNRGGVEENIGPEIQRITAAAKQGATYFREIYLRTKEAREEFDRLLKSGKSYTEATQAAGRSQFLDRATQVDEGRVKETLYTLTGAINNFKTEWDKARAGLMDGMNPVVTSIVNIAAKLLELFNNAPGWVKTSISLGAAIVGIGGSMAGAAGMSLMLALNIRRVVMELGALNAARAASIATGGGETGVILAQTGALAANAGARTVNSGATVINTGAIAVNTGADIANTGAIAVNTGATAANTGVTTTNTTATIINTGAVAANTGGMARNTLASSLFTKVTGAATGAVGLLTGGLRALGLLNPYGAILAGITTVLGASVILKKQTQQIYTDIKKSDDEFWDNMSKKQGPEFTDAMKQWSKLGELREKTQQSVNAAQTPQERADYEQAIKHIDAQRESLLKLARTISEKRKAENGAAQTTLAQIEAYKQLGVQIDAVKERFGSMKLTDFQKELTSVQKEQKRLFEELAKQENEYLTSNRESGLSPQQAAGRRKEIEALIPAAMRGLAQREADAAAKSAVDARRQMETDLNNLVKDGVEKRRRQLSIETRAIQDEYAQRLRTVRANMKDKDLQPDATKSEAENKARAAALRQFAQVEYNLIQERNQRVKVLEKQSSEDVLQIQRERDEKIIDGMKVVAQQQAELVRARLEGSALGRDRALGTQDTAQRLQTEKAFYGATLSMAQEAARREAAIRRGEAEVEFRKAMYDAQFLGEHRAKAESLAREKYQGSLKANEVQLQNDLVKARTDADNRVFSARAALLRETADQELRDIGKVEGVRLQALLQRYQQQLRLAQQRGDGESAQILRDTIRTVQDEARGRVEATNTLITETNTQITDLSQKLGTLTTKAAKGVEAVRTTAAQPFDEYLKSVRDERGKLEEAKKKLLPDQTGQRAALEQQLAQLDRLTAAGVSARTQAMTRAAHDFQQKENDRIMQERAKLAEKLYDGGEGDTAVYQAALRAEMTYWTARLKGMEQGSDEYEQAQTRLEDIRQKQREARLRAQVLPLEQARIDLSLNEKQLEGARTEAERNNLLAERIRLLGQVLKFETARANNPELKRNERNTAQQNAADARAQLRQATQQQALNPIDDTRARLSDLASQRELVKGDQARAEIDTQRLRVAQQIASLSRQQAERGDLPLAEQRQAQSQMLADQKQVQDLQRGIREQAEATTRSVQDLAAAQVDYNLALGRTDAEITAAMRGQLAITQAQIGYQDKLIADAIKRGEPEAFINGLKTQRLQLQRQELTQAQQLAARPLEIAERTLRITEAQNAYRAAIAMTNAETLKAKQGEMLATQQEIGLIDERIGQADKLGLKEEQVDALKQGRLQAQIKLWNQEKDIREYLNQLSRDSLALLESETRLRMAQSGADTDPVAVKQNELDTLRRQISQKQAETRGASEGERVRLQTEINDLLTDEITKQRELIDLGLQRQDSALRLQQAETAYITTTAQTTAQQVAARQQAISDTQAEINALDRRIAKQRELGLNETQVNDLKTQRLQAQTRIYEQQRGIREYLHQLDRDSLALLESQIKLQNIRSGATNDPIAAKQEELNATRRQVAQLTAEQQGATQEERVKLQTQVNGLLGDEITKQRELASLDFQRRQSAVSLAQAQQKANLEISGMADDAVASARLDAQISRDNLRLKQEEIALAEKEGKGEAELNNLRAQAAELTGQIAAGERRVGSALTARLVLYRKISDAEKELSRTLLNGEGANRELDGLLPNGKDIGSYAKSIEEELKSIPDLKMKVAEDSKRRAELIANRRILGNELAEALLHENAQHIAASLEQIERAKATAAIYRQLSADMMKSQRDVTYAEAEGLQRVLVPALLAERDARQETAAASAAYMALETNTHYNATTQNMEALQEAAERLNTAIQKQRDASKELANAYRGVISSMDAVRTASDNLRKTAYGDVGAELRNSVESVNGAMERLQKARSANNKKSTEETRKELSEAQAAYDEARAKLQGERDKASLSRETARFDAIATRRRALLSEAQNTLRSGDQERIAKTLQALDEVERRYREQARFLSDLGYGVRLTDETELASVIDAADRLGIQYDRQAGELSRRAAIAEQEAQAVNKFGEFVLAFKESVDGIRKKYGTEEAVSPAYSEGRSWLDAVREEESRKKAATEAAAKEAPAPVATKQEVRELLKTSKELLTTQSEVNVFRDVYVATEFGGKQYTTVDGRVGGVLKAVDLLGQARDLEAQIKSATDPKQAEKLKGELKGVVGQLDAAQSKYEAALAAQQKADLAAANKTEAAAPPPPPPAVRQATQLQQGGNSPAAKAAGDTGARSITHNYGGFTINVQTAKDYPQAAELVDEVMREIQNRADLMGVNC